jgi:VWFA-related protein
MRIFLLATSLNICAVTLFVNLQGAQSNGTEARLRATTRLIQVNVIVTGKHGNPVTGLTKDDFQVFDNKKSQEIQFFSAEDNLAPDQTTAPLPPNTFTNRLGKQAGTPESVTVILLDALNSNFSDQALVRQQVLRFLNQLQPRDRVALYWLGQRLRVLHNFTTDASELRDTLVGFASDSSQNPASSQVDDARSNNSNSSAPAGQTSSREAFREAFAQRVTNESTRDRVHFTVAALIEIANHIGSLHGRKSIVWVSGSFPIDLGKEKFDLNWANDTGVSFSGEVAKAAQALSDADISIYPVDARGLIGDGASASQDSSDAHPEFSSEDGHLPAGGATGNIETMKTLAARTGARAFYGTNDLSGSIRRALDDSRSTYTLSYLPTGMKWDGTFHNIKVTVKVPGAEVRARAGYFAIADSAATSPKTAQTIISQAALSPLDATAIGMRVEIRAPDNPKSRIVTTYIQLDLREIQMRLSNDRWAGAIQSTFLQLDKRGEIIHVDDEIFQLSLTPALYEQSLKNDVRETERIQILPLAVQLCIALRDPSTGNLGSIRIPLAKYVPAEPANPN